MTDSERQAFGEQLRALITQLQSAVAGSDAMSKPVSLDDPIGRLSRVDAMQQQHMAAAQARHARDEITAAERALVRVENGTYGDCLECGEQIDLRRLQARPAVPLCMACQRAREA